MFCEESSKVKYYTWTPFSFHNANLKRKKSFCTPAKSFSVALFFIIQSWILPKNQMDGSKVCVLLSFLCITEQQGAGQRLKQKIPGLIPGVEIQCKTVELNACE